MEIQTLTYKQEDGRWSENFADLDSEQTLVIIFAAPEYIDNALPILQLSDHYPTSKIIGCSSAGEIFGPHVLDNSISAAIIKFNQTTLEITKDDISHYEDSLSAGEHIAKTLFKKNLQAIFVLSEGLNVNGSELVRGLNKNANKDIVITGGLAGDGKNFKKTWIIYQGKIITKNIVAVGFYGSKMRIGHASRGGWEVFGPERLVTRSRKNILYELDDRPALALYKEYLGKKASELPASGLLYPLGIRENSQNSNTLVRTILGIDEKQQSLIFAGDIPEGYLAQLMRSNFEKLIASASEAGNNAFNMILDKEIKPDSPILTIAVSCVGRRLLMGERSEEEVESLLEIFPSGTKQIGFYSYGELSPYSTGDCSLHNQTMTVTSIYE
jgi:hypothetical protein